MCKASWLCSMAQVGITKVLCSVETQLFLFGFPTPQVLVRNIVLTNIIFLKTLCA